MQNRRMKKIIWDSILIMLVLVILGGVLYLVQTRFSMRQQEENFELELDLAERKLAANQTTVTESRASFDAFSQAKADTLAYYYRAHATDDLAREAEEWELKELYVLDMDHKIVASNRTAEITRELEQTFEDLIKTQQPVDADMTAYYIARLGDGRILIAGRDLQNEYDYENSLLDPKTALSDVRIGNTGYIVAVDSNEGVITYHPQKELIGKSVEEVGISRRHLVDDYYGWITRQDRQFYCHCKQTGDTILIATIPETEVKSYSIRKIEMILAMFAVILIIIVTYVNMIHGDRLKNHQHQNEKDVIQIGKHLYFDKILAGKCKNILVIGIVLIFCSSYYIQWLSILSAQTVSFDNKLKAMNIVFDENKAILLELENGYNNEYARRAENIAALIAHEPSLLDDNKMMDLTKRAQIESIYVFDDQGKVEVTNTAYKDFTLSRKEEDQSYAFWDVVKGYKTVLVQEAMEDDTTEHGYMQYIGVARQDAPGMVQIAVAPKRLQARIKTTKLTYALHDVAVENKGFVFAIDEESQNVIFYTNSNYVNEPADKLGVTDAIYVDGYTGYQTVAGVKCFVSGIKYENQYIYVAVPVRNIGSGIFVVTVIVTAISFLLMLVLMGSLFIRRRVDDIQGEEPDDQEPKEETQEFKAEPRGMIDVQLGEKPRRVQSIVGRYDNQNKIRWNERSPEEKITRIIYIVMLILACAFVVFIYLQRGTYNRNSIFSYIINRKWEKKPNIFSYTYIAIVMIEVIVITSVLRKLIKTVSSNMGVRAETIGRLVCSFAKYISIIGAIFYCMSFIGIDSKALFASAGIMGIVLGLGAQSLISDVLAGIFIVFEGEFRVGDIITIGTWRGTVLEIGIRSTKVEDASQNIKIFNNSTVKEVVNMTKKYSQAYCDLGIEYDESLEHVESVLKKELPLMKERLEHIVAGPYYKGVVGLNDSSVTLRILAQCEEKNRIQLTRDLTRELKLMCDRYNISIPFPQVVVNQPREHKKVTKREKSMAEEFVKEQKEDSKGISVDN